MNPCVRMALVVGGCLVLVAAAVLVGLGASGILGGSKKGSSSSTYAKVTAANAKNTGRRRAVLGAQVNNIAWSAEASGLPR